MVAMGTSLADKAWDRDSAVYRVSGVINVISGWLLTALLAFTTAGIIACLLYFFQIYALIGLVLFVMFLVYKTNVAFKKRLGKKSEISQLFGKDVITSEELYLESEQRIGVALQEVGTLIQKVIDALGSESKKKIEKVSLEARDFSERYETLYGSFYATLKKTADAKSINYPKPDGQLTFDRLSSLYLAGLYHQEDQPVHLQLADTEQALISNLLNFAEPAQRYCPAGVYEVIDDETGGKVLHINAQNCVHCKTCDIKDPAQNITWVTPEGGSGPNYSNM